MAIRKVLGVTLLLVLAVAAATAVVAWRRAPAEGLPVVVFSGPTMGTTYRVTIVRESAELDRRAIQGEIEATLARVDELMSTYREDSELSRFNASSSTDWQPIAPETAEVLQTAIDISRRSGGAYDVTCKPLVDAWSAAARASPRRLPDKAEIAAVSPLIGPESLELRADPPAVRKRHPRTTVVLSSIAPGYAADLIGAALQRRGLRRFLIDVGGELLARGRNAFDRPWQVGIDRPALGPPQTYAVVGLKDAALSTSGDYRNFFQRDGKRYSHLIDPRSGRPIDHGLTSVTVIAPTCCRADGYSTALIVLGPEEGYDLAVREGLQALFIIRDGEKLHQRRTPNLTDVSPPPTAAP